jgi:hypothetical protein
VLKSVAASTHLRGVVAAISTIKLLAVVVMDPCLVAGELEAGATGVRIVGMEVGYGCYVPPAQQAIGGSVTCIHATLAVTQWMLHACRRAACTGSVWYVACMPHQPAYISPMWLVLPQRSIATGALVDTPVISACIHAQADCQHMVPLSTKHVLRMRAWHQWLIGNITGRCVSAIARACAGPHMSSP